MAIPDFQTIMLPLLRYAADAQEHSLQEAIEHLASEFSLSETERKELLPSGQQATFDNRVGWSRTHLKKAGLLDTTKRGYFKITERGTQALAQHLERIDLKYLQQYEEFVEFRSRKRDKNTNDKDPAPSIETPKETIESGYQKLREDLIGEILHTIKTCSPAFFERLVVDLLLAMGYGGSRKEAGQAVGRSGDGGIDGIIKEDKLGLDIIYIQAKRWDSTVGSPEVQKFVGALAGKQAKKGIFLTTADFSKQALDYVSRIDSKIILVDGVTLAELMIDHNIGVSTTAVYELKKLDSDYFTEA